MAQAVWQLGKDKPRALRLAEDARNLLRKVHHRKKELFKVSIWLKEHGGGAPARGGEGEGEAHEH